MKILQIHNYDNRLDRLIPALELITQQHGTKNEGWYYIIPAVRYQFDNDQYLNIFFNTLAQRCFGTYASIMFII